MEDDVLTALSRFSLLTDDAETHRTGAYVDDRAWHDLRLGHLLEYVTPEREIARLLGTLLRSTTVDSERRRRREVLSDFVTIPELHTIVETVYPRISELRTTGDREGDREILKLVWRLGELNLTVEIVDAIGSGLERAADRLTAPALKELHRLFQRGERDRLLTELRRQLPKLRAGIRDRRSVTIGVNLDDHLRPVEATLLSINEEPFRNQSTIDAVGRAIFGSDTEYRTRTPIHRNDAPPDRPGSRRIPLAPLFQDLDEILKSESRGLARGLKRFTSVQTEAIAGLVREIALFSYLADAMQRLNAGGYPVSIPGSNGAGSNGAGSNNESGRAAAVDTPHAEDLYDPLLALERIQSSDGAAGVVTNELPVLAGGAPLILTGPNNGGKTTYLRAMGIAHLFANAGLFVAARYFSAPTVSQIRTHFVGGEAEGLRTGRFAEEARSLARTLETVEGGALVLLNETFSSTGSSEAVELAEELLAALGERRCTVAFATHLYDIVPRLRDRCVSLTIRPDAPYHFIRGVPDGHSLARAVAKEVGLDFDRLRRER